MSNDFQPSRWDYQNCLQKSARVKNSADGYRLDTFVTRFLAHFSRQEVQKLIDQKMITINDSYKKASSRVHSGDFISMTLPRKVPFHEIPSEEPVPILYEDEWLVVVNKPPQMVIHPVSGQLTNTLMNSLTARYSGEGQACPKPVHRLDRGVSGIVIAAKDSPCARKLSQLFKQCAIRKTYCALVQGRLSTTGEITSQPVILTDRRGNTVTKPAQTEFYLLKHYTGISFVKIIPLTGRKHQIRYHAMGLGHPIVGDRRYGGSHISLLSRPALHAMKISLQHPMSTDRLTITAPLPADFREVLAMLNREVNT